MLVQKLLLVAYLVTNLVSLTGLIDKAGPILMSNVRWLI